MITQFNIQTASAKQSESQNLPESTSPVKGDRVKMSDREGGSARLKFTMTSAE